MNDLMNNASNDLANRTGTADDARVDVSADVLMEAPLVRGDRVGRMRITSRLGKGGMGVVFGAHDPDLDRKVAIKMIRPDIGQLEIARARIAREARALAKLAHPNIVTVHDIGLHDDQLWIALEHVDGQTVSDWLRDSRRTWREVRDVFVQAARGLAAAHESGVLHRDLKPGNLMITSDGRVRVMDFGLARFVDSLDEIVAPEARAQATYGAQEHTLTQSSCLAGTPEYMAPELILGLPADELSDQYSLCVSLWKALYGQMPIAADSGHALDIAITSGDRVPPPPSDVPRWLRKVVERGLAPRPEDRFASVEELLAALEDDPTRRRWFGAISLCALLALGGWWGHDRIEHQRKVTACNNRAAAIHDSWTDDIRTNVQRGLLATDVGYARTAAQRVDALASAYVDDWETTARGVCQAHVVEERWNTEDADQAWSCLEERRSRLDVLFELLSESSGKGDVARFATKSVSALPDIQDCGDRRHLQSLPTLPPESEKRNAIHRIRKDLARAAALRAAKRYGESQPFAQQAERDAEQLGWAPVFARAKFELGALMAQSGPSQTVRAEAEANLEGAYFTARVAGADEVAFAAALLLSYHVGMGAQRRPDSLRWIRHAEVLLDRRQVADDDERRAMIATNRGIYHGRKNDNLRAIEELEKALAIRRKPHNHDDLEIAVALKHLSQAYDQADDQERALDLLTQALEKFRKGLGEDHPNVAIFMISLAYQYKDRGQYDEALAVYKDALAKLEAAFGPDNRQVASALLGLGKLHRNLGTFEQAIAYTERALAIRKRVFGTEHPFVAEALYTLGIIHGDREALDEAWALVERALAIWSARQLENDPSVALAHHSLCLIHQRRGAPERAAAHCAKASH